MNVPVIWDGLLLLGAVDAERCVMPAAILQPPLFHSSYPKYINYGLMGAIIGHEITHGFDQMGHQYDKRGSLKNWWSESSKKNFQERTKCIRNQYGNYVESTIREHFYCSNIRKERIQLLLKTDTHSPNEIRVNGAVSNSPMFAKAYGCPKGSPMNPERKCSLW